MNDTPRISDVVKCEHVPFTYVAHIKPLEDALVKAEEREKVLVEALEWCVDIIEENKKFSMDSAEDAVKQARAVLASVKGES